MKKPKVHIMKKSKFGVIAVIDHLIGLDVDKNDNPIYAKVHGLFEWLETKRISRRLKAEHRILQVN